MGFYDKMKQERLTREALSGPRPAYKILQVNQLKEEDKRKAAALASFVNSREDAHKLAGHEGVAYRDLDLRGRVGVVVYRGVEVGLRFKREVVLREPGPAEPIPERTLKDPDGEWIQIDLTAIDEAGKQYGIADRLRKAMDQISRLQLLWKKEENEKIKLQESLDKLANIRQELKMANERIGLLETAAQSSIREIDSLKRDLKKQVQKTEDEKRTTIEEMFPIFNTLWLAGVHRVADSLYDSLRRQLISALKRIGVDLIEPAPGDEFDPLLHHAIHVTECEEGAKEIGAVIQVTNVGWKFEKGPVARAAEVIVGVEKKIQTEELA